MSPVPDTATDSPDNVIEQSVAHPSAANVENDVLTPCTTMSAVIGHSPTVKHPINTSAAIGATPSHVEQPNTVRRTNTARGNKGPKIIAIQRSFTNPNPGSAQSITYPDSAPQPLPFTSHFPFHALKSAFTFSFKKPSHVPDQLQMFNTSDIRDTRTEDAYDRSRGAYFRKPCGGLPPVTPTTPMTPYQAYPVIPESMTDPGHHPSMQLQHPNTGNPQVVARTNIKSMQAEISGPLWPGTSRRYSNQQGNYQGLLAELDDGKPDIDGADQSNGQDKRSASKHKHTSSTPGRVESGSFADEAAVDTPRLSALPAPLFVRPRAQATSAQHDNIDSDTVEARIAGLETRMKTAHDDMAAGLNRVETKLNQILDAVEHGSRLNTVRHRDGSGGKGGKGKESRTIRGNLVGMPPHIPFGGMEGWYEQAKRH